MGKVAWLPFLVFAATLSALQPGTITIDSQEWKDEPVRHLVVRGTLNGDTAFHVLLPQPETWKSRIVHFLSGSAGHRLAGEQSVQAQYALAKGAVFVESTQGNTNSGIYGDDDTVAEQQYEASYTVMQYAKSRSVELYATEPRYVYVYGSSGGGVRASTLIERFPKVYDGAMTSLGAGTLKPVWHFASLFEYYRRALTAKVDAMEDAVGLNGEGDPFSVLTTPEEKDALRILLTAGMPKALAGNLRAPFQLAHGAMTSTKERYDPEYFDDFWRKGWGGKEAGALVVEGIPGTVTEVEPEKRAITVAAPGAPADPQSYTVTFTSGTLAGKRTHIRSYIGAEWTIGPGFDAVAPGDRFVLDNRDFVAFLYYHRHIADPDWPGAAEFYNGGKPRYPQRSAKAMLGLGESDRQVGLIQGKMITFFSTHDPWVWPTYADRYRMLVERHLGPSVDDHYRIYFLDNGSHGRIGRRQVHGHTSLYKALDDLMAWVERDVPPPPSTQYKLDELNQLVLPMTAAERQGYQPVVRLSADGKENRIQVEVGYPVKFQVRAEDPDNDLSKLEIDFDGDDQFDQTRKLTGREISQEFSFSYDKPGVYKATVCVTDTTVSHSGQTSNMAGIRVVVQ